MWIWKVTFLLSDGGVLAVSQRTGRAVTQPCDVVFITTEFLTLRPEQRDEREEEKIQNHNSSSFYLLSTRVENFGLLFVWYFDSFIFMLINQKSKSPPVSIIIINIHFYICCHCVQVTFWGNGLYPKTSKPLRFIWIFRVKEQMIEYFSLTLTSL